MVTSSADNEFIEHLRAEKLAAQKARSDYALRKLAYATAFLGIGSLQTGTQHVNLSWVLYLVPLIALTFDLYILGEDFAVKRIGGFLRAHSETAAERRWEEYAAHSRDAFAPFAMPLLSTLLLIAAAIVIWIEEHGRVGASPLFWAWLVGLGIPGWLLYFYYRQKRRTLDQANASWLRTPRSEGNSLATHIGQIRAAVGRAQHVLSTEVYHAIQAMFASCQADETARRQLALLAPEYGHQEFLPCVDAQGLAAPIPPKMLQDAREEMAHHPELRSWFRLEEDPQPTLLVARWLCHLVGIRHPTVHLFIDHPTLSDHTLIQVRGAAKLDYPACFDLPVAGHVNGTQPAEKALHRELAEELGLISTDLYDLHPIGTYDCISPLTETGRWDIEFRRVYTSRLAADALGRIHFTDGEVAAISIFSLAQLQEVAAHFPEKIASGLAHSLAHYLQAKQTSQYRKATGQIPEIAPHAS